MADREQLMQLHAGLAKKYYAALNALGISYEKAEQELNNGVGILAEANVAGQELTVGPCLRDMLEEAAQDNPYKLLKVVLMKHGAYILAQHTRGSFRLTVQSLTGDTILESMDMAQMVTVTDLGEQMGIFADTVRLARSRPVAYTSLRRRHVGALDL